MRPCPIAFLGAAALVALGGAAADRQTPLGGSKNPFDDVFRALVADTLAAWHVPGVAIAVVDGDVTWTEGFGLAVRPETPVTADTLFYTASTTKAFVATALGLFMDSGNYTALSADTGDVGDPPRPPPLDWTTPLAAILRDDFVVGGGSGDDAWWATTHLTVDDALAHRTGLGMHDLARARRYGLADPHTGAPARFPAGVREVTRSLRYLPLTTAPRTAYRYCNLMYLVLSHAIETLAGGQWLGDVLRARLWAPLGMASTFLRLADAEAAPAVLAQGYYWAAGGTGSTDDTHGTHGTDADTYTAVPHMPLDEVSGAGGIISSVADYARWLRCWIDGFAACGIPLSDARRDHLLAPKIFTSTTAGPFDMPVAYASAWTTSSYRGHRFWGHSGGSNAYGAEVYFFPDLRFGAVLFGNTASTSNAAELVLLWHLVDERLGAPPAERYDWTTMLQNKFAVRAARLDSALNRLYPDRAQPPLPPSLPLDAFVGTYYHPAYQNMTLQLADKSTENYAAGAPAFVAERREFTWPTVCTFVHVSGDHYALYTDMLFERSGHFRGYGRARFDIGADGRATALVVEFWDVDDDVVEGVFSFQRIA